MGDYLREELAKLLNRYDEQRRVVLARQHCSALLVVLVEELRQLVAQIVRHRAILDAS